MAALAIAGLQCLTGCSSDAGGDRSTDLVYPSTADALVFRLTALPSSLPPAGTAVVVPELSVYGDGTIIVNRSQESASGSIATLFVGRVDADAVGDVLASTRRLADDLASAGANGAEQSTGRVVEIGFRIGADITATSAATTIRVAEGALPAGIGEARTTFPELAGSVYEAARYAIVTWDGASDVTAEWPLDASPSDAPTLLTGHCMVLSDDQAPAARAAFAKATPATTWIDGADRFQAALRPLLPDETDCTSL